MIDSIKKYQFFDLALLCIMAVVSEIMANLLLNIFPGAGFYLSFSSLIALIAMVRWGKIGAIVYLMAGIPMIFLGNGTYLENILIYPLANLFIILISWSFKYIDSDKLKSNNAYILIYVIGAYISVGLGKGMANFIINGFFLKGVIYYLMGELFNIVMVLIVFFLIKGKSGLLENMREYFNKNE